MWLNDKKKVLFLCTHNSARSQMAEGLLNALKGDIYEAYSAGVEPTTLDPEAVKAMAEIGIDISGQRSKGLEEVSGVEFDTVVTVCDAARESCPIFFGARSSIHQSFDDPATFQGGARSAAFRRVRDEIKDWLDASLRDI